MFLFKDVATSHKCETLIMIKNYLNTTNCKLNLYLTDFEVVPQISIFKLPMYRLYTF